MREQLLKKFVVFVPLAVLCQMAVAHPIPDIPVRSSFSGDGPVTIRVEVDPRCFASDPLNEPYLDNARLLSLERGKKAELLSKADAFIKDSIEFRAQPTLQLQPEFKMKFTTFANCGASDGMSELT